MDAVTTLLRAGDRLGAPSWERTDDDAVRILLPAPASAVLVAEAGQWKLLLGHPLTAVGVGSADRPDQVVAATSVVLLEAGQRLQRSDPVRAFAFTTGALFFAQSTGNVLVEAKSSELLGRLMIAQGDIEQGIELISRVAAPAFQHLGDRSHARELGALVEATGHRYDFGDVAPDTGAMLEQATAELLCADLLPQVSGSQYFSYEPDGEEGPLFSLKLDDEHHIARLIPHTYGWLLLTFSLSAGIRCRIVGLPGGEPADVVRRTVMSLAAIAADDLAAERLEDAEVWAVTAYRTAKETDDAAERARAAGIVAQVMLAVSRASAERRPSREGAGMQNASGGGAASGRESEQG